MCHSPFLPFSSVHNPSRCREAPEIVFSSRVSSRLPEAGHTEAWGVVRAFADETPGNDTTPQQRSSPIGPITGPPCRDRNHAQRCLVRKAVWLPYREQLADDVLRSWGCAALHPRLRCGPPSAGGLLTPDRNGWFSQGTTDSMSRERLPGYSQEIEKARQGPLKLSA